MKNTSNTKENSRTPQEAMSEKRKNTNSTAIAINKKKGRCSVRECENVQNNIEPQPEAMVSNSAAILIDDSASSRRRDNDSVVQELATDVKSTLKILQTGKSVDDIKSAVKFMESVTATMSIDERSQALKEFVEYGLFTLVCSLNQYSGSLPFVSATLSVLVEITSQDDDLARGSDILVELDGVEKVLQAAQKHNADRDTNFYALCALLNLNVNEETTGAVIDDECIDFCAAVMKAFPNDNDIQGTGARYFNETTKIADKKEILIEKHIGLVLHEAFYWLRAAPKKYKYDLSIAREALSRLYQTEQK